MNDTNILRGDGLPEFNASGQGLDQDQGTRAASTLEQRRAGVGTRLVTQGIPMGYRDEEEKAFVRRVFADYAAMESKQVHREARRHA